MKHIIPVALSVLLLPACADQPITASAHSDDAGLSLGIGEHGGGIPYSIAFPTARDGNREIYVMNADGSRQTRLTFHPAEDFIPAWSPSGQQIVFGSTRDGNLEIYVMNADGSNPSNLTNHPSVDGGPVFSPNGKKIAFQSNRDGNFELYLMNSDGSEQIPLTHHPGTDQWPHWSPNGKDIVFQRDGDIFVVNVATGETTQLTTDPAHDDMPVFSPNGKRIAFMSARDGYNAVFVMNADGSDPVNLTPRPAGETIATWGIFPEWSRNGQKIYFQAIRPETGPQSDIYVMNADGSGVARLTTDPGFDGAPAAR